MHRHRTRTGSRLAAAAAPSAVGFLMANQRQWLRCATRVSTGGGGSGGGSSRDGSRVLMAGRDTRERTGHGVEGIGRRRHGLMC